MGEELIFLHDFINIILVFIITFVGFIIVRILFNSFINKNLLERQIIECIWTIIPAVILIQIAIPSLLLLYMLDESIDSNLTIKAIGHQWYSRYEYRDFWAIGRGSQVEFDAYIIPTNELENSVFRLLDVDTRIVVPFNIHVRIFNFFCRCFTCLNCSFIRCESRCCPRPFKSVAAISSNAGTRSVFIHSVRTAIFCCDSRQVCSVPLSPLSAAPAVPALALMTASMTCLTSDSAACFPGSEVPAIELRASAYRDADVAIFENCFAWFFKICSSPCV